jgi:hypothetical protein
MLRNVLGRIMIPGSVSAIPIQGSGIGDPIFQFYGSDRLLERKTIPIPGSGSRINDPYFDSWYWDRF